MKVDDIKLFYDYNKWANNRILDAAQHASLAQLTAPNDLGWGDLHGTLAHILKAETYWFSFLFGAGDEAVRELNDRPDIAALRERCGRQSVIMRQCLDSLQDSDLNRVYARERGGDTSKVALWQALVHVVNHGTQHRAEAAALLTGFGHSPGDMDFTLFLRDR